MTTGEVVGTLPARRLLCACAEAAAAAGPGAAVRRPDRPLAHLPQHGSYHRLQPCGEFLHVADSACNLATLNLLAFLKDREFDIEGFTAAVELLVLAQDAIVDGSGYPSHEIELHAHRLRQIGIGYANLAALLLSLGIPYDSNRGRDWAAAITALMTGVAYRRSAELAAALGPFAEFERNREPTLQDRLRAGARVGVCARQPWRGRRRDPTWRIALISRSEAARSRSEGWACTRASSKDALLPVGSAAPTGPVAQRGRVLRRLWLDVSLSLIVC